VLHFFTGCVIAANINDSVYIPCCADIFADNGSALWFIAQLEYLEFLPIAFSNFKGLLLKAITGYDHK